MPFLMYPGDATNVSLSQRYLSLQEQSMTPPPETVGVFFAADFMKRGKQICETSHHTPQYASVDMNAVKPPSCHQN